MTFAIYEVRSSVIQGTFVQYQESFPLQSWGLIYLKDPRTLALAISKYSQVSNKQTCFLIKFGL